DGITLHAETPRLLQRLHDVARVAAAGENQEQVPLVGERGQLETEDFIIALIIAEAGEHGSVLGESADAKGRALPLRYRVKKSVGNWGGVAGAAAVAAQKHLASGAPTVAQILREPDHRRPIEPMQKLAEAPRVALEVLCWGFAGGRGERVLHGSVHGAGLKLFGSS